MLRILVPLMCVKYLFFRFFKHLFCFFHVGELNRTSLGQNWNYATSVLTKTSVCKAHALQKSLFVTFTLKLYIILALTGTSYRQ